MAKPESTAPRACIVTSEDDALAALCRYRVSRAIALIRDDRIEEALALAIPLLAIVPADHRDRHWLTDVIADLRDIAPPRIEVA